MSDLVATGISPGFRLGNYVLEEEIGRGAFSHIWKATHHEQPGRVVAVKIAANPAYRRYLSREGILPEINHRNAVPILDADTRFADFPYIVMPYYRNGTLADLVAQHPARLPEDRVRSLLQDLLAGLAAAHQRGIIHRDIKPSNVLLDDQGAAVVGDFGLSLSDSSLEGLRSIVQSGSWAVGCQPTIVGTLAYMAPEILEGKPATSASDVYSVGIILFEMLTGRRPNGVEFPEEVRSDLLESSRWRTLYAASCAHHSSGSGMLVQC